MQGRLNRVWGWGDRGARFSRDAVQCIFELLNLRDWRIANWIFTAVSLDLGPGPSLVTNGDFHLA